MKNILHIIIVLAMAAAVVSCALVPMDVNKVLELKPDQKIYPELLIILDVTN